MTATPPPVGPAPETGANPLGSPQEPQQPIQAQQTADAFMDENAFFDQSFQARSAEIEARMQGQSQEVIDRLIGDQWAIMAMQQHQAESMGLDAATFWQGTEILNPGLVEDRWVTLQGERFALSEAIFKNPEIGKSVEALKSRHNVLLSQFRQAQSLHLQAFNATDDPQERLRLATAIFPLVQDGEYQTWQAELQKINKALLETKSGFNVFNHPDTAAFAKGLTALVGTAGPDAFLMREGDPMSPASQVGGVMQAVTSFGDSLTAGTVGLGLKGLHFLMQMGADATAWATGQPQVEVPNFHDAFSYTLDENGNPLYTGGTFGMPEMAASFMSNFIGEEAAMWMAAQGRAEIDIMKTFDDADLQGIVNGTAGVVGALVGAQKMLFNPAMKAATSAEMAATRGIAYLASGTKLANALKKSIGLIGGSATMALEMGATTGRYEEFGQAALTGAMMFPAISIMGAFGDKFEAAALGGKLRGPLWNVGASMARNAMEGLGIGLAGAATGVTLDPMFSLDTEEGRVLQRFLSDPSEENTKEFVGYMTEWVVANAMVGAMFGRAQQRHAIAKHGAAVQAKLDPGQWTDEQLYKRSKKSFEKGFQKHFGREWERMKEPELAAAMEKAQIIEPETLSHYTPLVKGEVMQGLGQLAELFRTEAEIVKKAEARGQLYTPLRKVLEAHGGEVSVEGGAVTIKADGNLMNRIVRHQLRMATRYGIQGSTAKGHHGKVGDTELMVIVHPMDPMTSKGFQIGKGHQWRLSAVKGSAGLVDTPEVSKVINRANAKDKTEAARVTSIHTHPNAAGFSNQDIQFFTGEFWQKAPTSGEFAPQMAIGSEGGFVIRPGQHKYPPNTKNFTGHRQAQKVRSTKDLAHEVWHGSVFKDDIPQGWTTWARNRYKTQEELVRAIEHADMYLAGSEQSIPPELMPAIHMMREVHNRALAFAAKQTGLEFAFFSPQTLAKKWDEYMRTGRFDMSGSESLLKTIADVRPRVEQAAAQMRKPIVGEQKPPPEGLDEPIARPEEPMRQEDIDDATAEAGRLEKVMKDEPEPPTTEEGVIALKKGFEQQSTYWSSVNAFTQFAKKIKANVTEFFGRYFTDKGYRQALAHRLRNTIGYGAKFLTLGPDEGMIKARADVLRATVANGEKLVRVQRSKIFEPILRDENLSKGERQKQIDDVLQFAVLRDLEANAEREVEVPTGQTDAQGNPILEKKVIQRDLPFGVTKESVSALRAEIEARMTDAQREAYVNIRASLDEAWDSMVARGLVSREDALPDYFPHKILDWSEADHPGIGNTLPSRRPGRGYLKGRQGSRRMFDTSIRALQDYLLKVHVNNAKHDFLVDTAGNIHTRALRENGLEDVDWGDLDPKEWAAIRSRMDEEGYVLLDTRYGRTGRETLDRDPLVQKLLSDIMVEAGIPMMPEVVVGKHFRPNPEKGIFYVTKEYAEFLRNGQTPNRFAQLPALRIANQLIGRWIKGPMLRGFMGAATVARASRNMVSDLHGIYMKGAGGIRDVLGVMKNMPAARRVIEAYRMRDTNPEIVNKLSDYEFSILQEMEARGTLQVNVRGQEFLRDDPIEVEWLNKVMPETGGYVRRMLSKLYRADFKWARALDDYSENLLRVGYFMRERMARLENMGPNAMETELAADYAHLKTGEVLINYNHLTPLERHALNGIVFPFYTWAKGNFTGILGAVAEAPIRTLGRAAAAAAPFVAWNALMAKDEEERLWHKAPWMAAKPHLILPYARDSFGNPMVISFDSTMGEALKFLGMDQLDSDAMQYLVGHRNEAIFAKDLVPGAFENMARAWRSFVAPWMRSIGGQVFSSEFVTPGERAEQLVQVDLPQVSRPWADVQAMLQISKKERSDEERWAKFAPFVGYVDLFEGVSADALPQHYLAGRIQRRESQLAGAIGDNMRRFTSGLKAGDADQMAAAIERVWDRMGDELDAAGITEYHLLSRFIERAVRQLKAEALIESGISPKWLQLSRSQRAELLMTLLEER